MKHVAFVAALLGVAGGAAAQPMFGVGGFSSFGIQSLYSINPLTGAATLVGSTGLRQIADLAWDESSQRLLAITVDADLYAINPFTAQSLLVAARDGTLPEGGLAVGNGALFTVDGSGLGSINAVTAALNQIGGGLGIADNDISGLVFAGSSLFGYAKNGTLEDSIVSIDTVSGSATRIGLVGFDSASSVGGLAVVAGGDVYLSSGDALYTVNASTGVASFVGSFGVAGMSGITVIPSPGVGSLAMLAMGMAMRRRR